MWLAHMFGQRGTKNKIKLTKAGAHVFGQISYSFTVKKRKKEIEHKAGGSRKKKGRRNRRSKEEERG